MEKNLNTPILDMLSQVAQQSVTRFCMPGHKGGGGFLPDSVGQYDITELDGADNLYAPQGVIAHAQQLHADYIGAAGSFFLVNGSSVGVHAAVQSALMPTDTVIVARDVHLSAIHAFVQGNVNPVFVTPDSVHDKLPSVVTVQEIRDAIRKHPHAKAVYVTYPNYYGLCCDLPGICAEAHAAGMQVICDGAHAAAYDFSAILPWSPAEAGCDYWVTSLHKTLPALNQCATLSVAREQDAAVAQSRLNLLQTTSPSYLLLGSGDYALAYMRAFGKERIAAVAECVEENIRKIEAIGGYACVLQDVPRQTGAVDRDILRLVIEVEDRGVSGFTAAKQLADQGVSIEAADLHHVILICGVADEPEHFDRLREALGTVRGTHYSVAEQGAGQEWRQALSVMPVMSLRKAFFAPREHVPLEHATGRVSACCAGAYPPGVPVIIPGQEITQESVGFLRKLRDLGYTLFGCDVGIDVAML